MKNKKDLFIVIDWKIVRRFETLFYTYNVVLFYITSC